MNQPRQTATPARTSGARTSGGGRTWPETLRPFLPWSVPLLLVAAVFLAGLPGGGWRTPLDVAVSTNPVLLLPGLGLGLEPLSGQISRWLLTALLAAIIGVLVWCWRGGTAGYGFFSGCSAFSLSLLIEVGRWFKPGRLPDFHDPLIAAVVAFLLWSLLRRSSLSQPVTRLPRHGPWGTRWRVLLGFLFAWFGLGLCAGGLAAAAVIAELGYTPAQFVTIVEALPEGRSGFSGAVARSIVGLSEGTGLSGWLHAANAIDRPDHLPTPQWTGADEAGGGVLPAGRLRSVNTMETLRQAIDTARPGDVILLQPGTYRIKQNYIVVGQPGTQAAPIVVRAPRPGTVILESEMTEAIKVAAPHWRFENLVLRGVCADDTTCDNGFHVVGAAQGTVLRNLRIEDFNAHIKINGEGETFPDGGRIDHTTLLNTRPRQTGNPVTPIDLVTANDWVIESNLIADFIKAGGDTVSYGAFAKGAARGTVFSRNVILCEWRLRGRKGQTIGLSFGGGGTERGLRRERGRSGLEHADGVMTGNLIAFCSDDGIYLNRATNSVIRRNTLIATSGIVVRYPESTAIIESNMVDGLIRQRDDGLFWGEGNEASTLRDMFRGHNPVREMFADPGGLDLRWKRLPELVTGDESTDLCGVPWKTQAPPGAFQDFRACGAGSRP